MTWSDWGPVKLLRTIASQYSDDRCAQMAAALAYYTLFSLVPGLVIVVALTSALLQGGGFDGGREEVRREVVHQLALVVGTQPAETIADMLSEAQRRPAGGWPAILSVGALLFGATGAMAQLQVSLNQVWGVAPDPKQSGVRTFLNKRFWSLVMIVGIALLLLASLVLTTAAEWLQGSVAGRLPEQWQVWIRWLSNFVLQLVITTTAFAAVFKVLPDAEIRWRDVVVGAFATSLLFGIGRYTIGIYLGRSSVESAFGLGGSLVALLLWLYYSALIFLLGVEFTQAWVIAQGREIVPELGAVCVSRETRSPG